MNSVIHRPAPPCTRIVPLQQICVEEMFVRSYKSVIHPHFIHRDLLNRLISHRCLCFLLDGNNHPLSYSMGSVLFYSRDWNWRSRTPFTARPKIMKSYMRKTVTFAFLPLPLSEASPISTCTEPLLGGHRHD